MALLEGRISLVTGASRGIGRAIAKALAAEGAQVVLAARDTAKLADAVAEITGAGGRARPWRWTWPTAPRGSRDGPGLSAHGRLDHLVNNAAWPATTCSCA